MSSYAKLHQDARRALQVKGDARLRGSRVDVAALYTAEGSSLGEPGAAAGAPDQDLLHQQDQHQPFQKRLSSEPPPDPIIYASTESHLSPCGSPSLNDYMCHSRDTSALHMSTAPTSQRKLFEQQEDVSEDRIGESASGFGGSCHATGASWAGSASSITSSTSSASLCTETSSELVLQRLPDSMPAGLVMVQALVSASGQGCADILLLGAGKSTAGSSSRSAGPRDGTSKSVWKTRYQKCSVESYCILQLKYAEQENIIVQVVFANAGCVPAFVRFSHSSTATTAFATMVDDALLRQADGVHTKHMMRLPGRVQRFLKITFLGHAGTEVTGYHAVQALQVVSNSPTTPAASPPESTCTSARMSKLTLTASPNMPAAAALPSRTASTTSNKRPTPAPALVLVTSPITKPALSAVTRYSRALAAFPRSSTGTLPQAVSRSTSATSRSVSFSSIDCSLGGSMRLGSTRLPAATAQCQAQEATSRKHHPNISSASSTESSPRETKPAAAVTPATLPFSCDPHTATAAALAAAEGPCLPASPVSTPQLPSTCLTPTSTDAVCMTVSSVQLQALVTQGCSRRSSVYVCVSGASAATHEADVRHMVTSLPHDTRSSAQRCGVNDEAEGRRGLDHVCHTELTGSVEAGAAKDSSAGQEEVDSVSGQGETDVEEGEGEMDPTEGGSSCSSGSSDERFAMAHLHSLTETDLRRSQSLAALLSRPSNGLRCSSGSTRRSVRLPAGHRHVRPMSMSTPIPEASERGSDTPCSALNSAAGVLRYADCLSPTLHSLGPGLSMASAAVRSGCDEPAKLNAECSQVSPLHPGASECDEGGGKSIPTSPACQEENKFSRLLEVAAPSSLRFSPHNGIDVGGGPETTPDSYRVACRNAAMAAAHILPAMGDVNAPPPTPNTDQLRRSVAGLVFDIRVAAVVHSAIMPPASLPQDTTEPSLTLNLPVEVELESREGLDVALSSNSLLHPPHHPSHLPENAVKSIAEEETVSQVLQAADSTHPVTGPDILRALHGSDTVHQSDYSGPTDSKSRAVKFSRPPPPPGPPPPAVFTIAVRNSSLKSPPPRPLASRTTVDELALATAAAEGLKSLPGSQRKAARAPPPPLLPPPPFSFAASPKKPPLPRRASAPPPPPPLPPPAITTAFRPSGSSPHPAAQKSREDLHNTTDHPGGSALTGPSMSGSISARGAVAETMKVQVKLKRPPPPAPPGQPPPAAIQIRVNPATVSMSPLRKAALPPPPPGLPPPAPIFKSAAGSTTPTKKGPPPPPPPRPPPALSFSLATNLSTRAKSAPPSPPPPPPALTLVSAASSATGRPRSAPPPPPSAPPPAPIFTTGSASARTLSAPRPPPPPPPVFAFKSISSKSNQDTISASTAAPRRGPPPPPPPPSFAPLAALEAKAVATESTEEELPSPFLAARPPAGYSVPALSASAVTPEAPRPSKPTLKLYWQKMPAYAARNTVWQELTPLKVDLDYRSLEDQFAVAETAPSTTSAAGAASGAGSKGKGASKVMLLDNMQRANNLGVLLANIRQTPAQIWHSALQMPMKYCKLAFSGLDAVWPKCEKIKDALVKLTNTAGECSLSDEHLEAILKSLPTQDEVKQLIAYQGDRSLLGLPEQFLIAMISIPQLEQRMQAVKLMRQFVPRLGAVDQHVTTLMESCLELRSSSLLHLILKISLEIGNFLNTASNQGGAIGFQLDALRKLRDIKSTRNRSVSLLHFIAREVQKQLPDAHSLKGQLHHCQLASKLNLNLDKEELKQLKISVRILDRVLDGKPAEAQPCGTSSGDGPDGTTDSAVGGSLFESLVRNFQADASSKLSECETAFETAEKTFVGIRSYLNGSSNKMEVAAFFDILTGFADDLEQAHTGNADADAKIQQAQAREVAAAAKSAISPAPHKLGAVKIASQPTRRSMAASSLRISMLRVSISRQQRMLDSAVVATPKTQLNSHIRAYGRLRPEHRTMLTEQGGKERAKSGQITMRQSVPLFMHAGGQLRMSVSKALLAAKSPRTSNSRSAEHQPPPPAADLMSPILQQFSATELLRLSIPADLFMHARQQQQLDLPRAAPVSNVAQTTENVVTMPPRLNLQATAAVSLGSQPARGHRRTASCGVMVPPVKVCHLPTTLEETGTGDTSRPSNPTTNCAPPPSLHSVHSPVSTSDAAGLSDNTFLHQPALHHSMSPRAEVCQATEASSDPGSNLAATETDPGSSRPASRPRASLVLTAGGTTPRPMGRRKVHSAVLDPSNWPARQQRSQGNGDGSSGYSSSRSGSSSSSSEGEWEEIQQSPHHEVETGGAGVKPVTVADSRSLASGVIAVVAESVSAATHAQTGLGAPLTESSAHSVHMETETAAPVFISPPRNTLTSGTSSSSSSGTSSGSENSSSSRSSACSYRGSKATASNADSRRCSAEMPAVTCSGTQEQTTKAPARMTAAVPAFRSLFDHAAITPSAAPTAQPFAHRSFARPLTLLQPPESDTIPPLSVVPSPHQATHRNLFHRLHSDPPTSNSTAMQQDHYNTAPTRDRHLPSNSGSLESGMPPARLHSPPQSPTAGALDSSFDSYTTPTRLRKSDTLGMESQEGIDIFSIPPPSMLREESLASSQSSLSPRSSREHRHDCDTPTVRSPASSGDSLSFTAQETETSAQQVSPVRPGIGSFAASLPGAEDVSSVLQRGLQEGTFDGAQQVASMLPESLSNVCLADKKEGGCAESGTGACISSPTVRSAEENTAPQSTREGGCSVSEQVLDRRASISEETSEASLTYKAVHTSPSSTSLQQMEADLRATGEPRGRPAVGGLLQPRGVAEKQGLVPSQDVDVATTRLKRSASMPGEPNRAAFSDLGDPRSSHLDLSQPDGQQGIRVPGVEALEAAGVAVTCLPVDSEADSGCNPLQIAACRVFVDAASSPILQQGNPSGTFSRPAISQASRLAQNSAPLGSADRATPLGGMVIASSTMAGRREGQASPSSVTRPAAIPKVSSRLQVLALHHQHAAAAAADSSGSNSAAACSSVSTIQRSFSSPEAATSPMPHMRGMLPWLSASQPASDAIAATAAASRAVPSAPGQLPVQQHRRLAVPPSNECSWSGHVSHAAMLAVGAAGTDRSAVLAAAAISTFPAVDITSREPNTTSHSTDAPALVAAAATAAVALSTDSSCTSDVPSFEGYRLEGARTSASGQQYHDDTNDAPPQTPVQWQAHASSDDALTPEAKQLDLALASHPLPMFGGSWSDDDASEADSPNPKRGDTAWQVLARQQADCVADTLGLTRTVSEATAVAGADRLPTERPSFSETSLSGLAFSRGGNAALQQAEAVAKQVLLLNEADTGQQQSAVLRQGSSGEDHGVRQSEKVSLDGSKQQQQQQLEKDAGRVVKRAAASWAPVGQELLLVTPLREINKGGGSGSGYIGPLQRGRLPQENTAPPVIKQFIGPLAFARQQHQQRQQLAQQLAHQQLQPQQHPGQTHLTICSSWGETPEPVPPNTVAGNLAISKQAATVASARMLAPHTAAATAPQQHAAAQGHGTSSLTATTSSLNLPHPRNTDAYATVSTSAVAVMQRQIHEVQAHTHAAAPALPASQHQESVHQLEADLQPDHTTMTVWSSVSQQQAFQQHTLASIDHSGPHAEPSCRVHNNQSSDADRRSTQSNTASQSHATDPTHCSHISRPNPFETSQSRPVLAVVTHHNSVLADTVNKPLLSSEDSGGTVHDSTDTGRDQQQLHRQSGQQQQQPGQSLRNFPTHNSISSHIAQATRTLHQHAAAANAVSPMTTRGIGPLAAARLPSKAQAPDRSSSLQPRQAGSSSSGADLGVQAVAASACPATASMFSRFTRAVAPVARPVTASARTAMPVASGQGHERHREGVGSREVHRTGDRTSAPMQKGSADWSLIKHQQQQQQHVGSEESEVQAMVDNETQVGPATEKRWASQRQHQSLQQMGRGVLPSSPAASRSQKLSVGETSAVQTSLQPCGSPPQRMRALSVVNTEPQAQSPLKRNSSGSSSDREGGLLLAGFQQQQQQHRALRTSQHAALQQQHNK